MERSAFLVNLTYTEANFEASAPAVVIVRHRPDSVASD
jgi:hypothetical protein